MRQTPEEQMLARIVLGTQEVHWLSRNKKSKYQIFVNSLYVNTFIDNFFFRATLIGVVSWSFKPPNAIPCDPLYSPSVFARVTKVLKWIKDNTEDACTNEGKKLESYDLN